MHILVLVTASTFGLLSSTAHALPSVVEMCKLQKAAAVPQDPDVVLAPQKLSKYETEKISDAHACIKSYAHQFVGGLDALMEADPAKLKKNLDELRVAFANPKNVPFAKDNPYSVRMAFIRDGWDREQVLLFGNQLMLLRLYESGDYAEVLRVVAELRKEFRIVVKPIVWDEMQGHTYFSADTLRNMIASLEYLSKVRMPGTSKKSMAETVDAYLKDRSNLMPLGAFARNPDSRMFRGYCGSTE